MPRSSFTAPVEGIVFLRVYSGTDDTISRGLQEAIERLVAIDPIAAEAMSVAQWICERAEAALSGLGQSTDQEDVFKYVAENYADLMDNYRAAHS